MKFTKKDALEKLKQILTEGGKSLRMSERSLADLTDNLLAAEQGNEELELDTFVTKYKGIYVSFNGNVEHDVSSGVNDFKNQWGKGHSATGGSEGDKNSQGEGDKADPALKALLDRVDALEKTNLELRSREAISEKRKSILSKLKEKGIDDDDWSNGILEQISVDENTDVNSKAEQLLNFYNKTKSTPSGNFNPKTPGGSEQQPNNAIAAAAQRAKRAREEAEAALQE